jgi:hypothetical protein
MSRTDKDCIWKPDHIRVNNIWEEIRSLARVRSYSKRIRRLSLLQTTRVANDIINLQPQLPD